VGKRLIALPDARDKVVTEKSDPSALFTAQHLGLSEQ
jgi:hypothetical protein